MNVLHLASSNRWTGAAAPAFAEVASLRAVGLNAHYAYVGGYLLETRLRRFEFAHPILLKKQDPLSFARTVAAVRKLIRAHSIDVVQAHLTYDHVVAMAAAGRAVRVVRTLHSRRAFRRDPLSRALFHRTAAYAAVNEAQALELSTAREPIAFTPPPLDADEFSPHGGDVRRRYGIGADETVIGSIGKIAPGRGFEAVLHAFAAFTAQAPARLMIIGHGPHQAALDSLARQLGVSEQVVWAGYHEHDLAEHYRAMDQMLFTRAGSDEGHRAVLEALGCGVPVVSFPIEGVGALLGPLRDRLIAPEAAPDAAAAIMRQVSVGPRAAWRDAARQQALHFSYVRAGSRLVDLYRRLA